MQDNDNGRIPDFNSDIDDDGFNDSDFSDAINLGKRRIKRRIEKCFVCKMRIENNDLFRPCNCEFGYIHANCLRLWMQQKIQCRICLNNYDILNAPGSCGICRTRVDDVDNIRSCECKFRRHHKACIQKNVDDGLTRCGYCMNDYAIQTHVSWRLTSKYLQKAFAVCCKVASVICKTFFVLAWLTLSVFLVAPENILRRRFTTLETTDSSFILFPGNANFPAWLDIIYLSITLLLYCVFAVYSLIEGTTWDDIKGVWMYTPALILTPLFFHLFGNIYLKFYCKLSVIPAVNCYWMMNFNSLFVGTTFIYPPIVFYLFFVCFRQIFCKRVVTNTVIELNAV